ncbi:MAG: fructosamine kinase family protein [Anaerolineales bacterium]
MIPDKVRHWLQEQGHGAVTGEQSVGGGCINNGARLQTEGGATFFLKTNAHAPADMFAREAEGLAELRGDHGPRLPDALLWNQEFILLEDLAPAPRVHDYSEILGRQLAALHKRTKDLFGFEQDNYLGSTPQPNKWTKDGHEFFAEQRLNYQARLARDKDELTRAEAAQVERLAARLPELVPAQPASLTHGDLWGGNAIADNRGQPALIDPAAHYGWAEAELGMTALFGGFDSAFYRAYEESRPLDKGWRNRLPIYNLYQLLNHLNLFGAGYHAQVIEVLRRFA